MLITFSKWVRISYNKVTNSIAFYPAIIALGFLILSWGMLKIDFSHFGKEFKSGLKWLSLNDASTARSIISTVAGAIISLTVFSFSMVMIVLNQAASQMSNRVLNSMIGNRFQQTVLGFYIGTIVYALFLLSTIRDIDSGIYIPALSIYLLIVLTVVDIFLFIYFLDYVTQTIKYETVIERVKQQTMETVVKNFHNPIKQTILYESMPYIDIQSDESNYFQGFSQNKLLNIAANKKIHLSFLYKRGRYLVKGTVFIRAYSNDIIDKELVHEILATTDFYKGQPIDRNSDYGFTQLSEIAIKALSPAINDPGTAVLALNSLFDLFSYILNRQLPEYYIDDENTIRIFAPSSTFQELFEKCIIPIWNYGKNDQYIQCELIQMIKQLRIIDFQNQYTNMFDKLTSKIEKEIQ